MRRTRAALFALLLVWNFAPSGAFAKPAPDSTIQHNVVCSADVNSVTRTTTAVSVSAAVTCNGSVDVAYTSLTVQIFENGSWRNYGVPFETSATGPTLIMSDGAPLKSGTWSYRGRIHREAFHGTWGVNNWYGTQRTYTR